MVERPVDPRGSRSVMGDQYDTSELELCDHGVEIAFQVLERVRVPVGLVRAAPAEEVEEDDSPAAEVRHQAIVEPEIVRETMHEDEGGLAPGVFPGIDAVRAARDRMDQEGRSRLALRSRRGLRIGTGAADERRGRKQAATDRCPTGYVPIDAVSSNVVVSHSSPPRPAIDRGACWR